MRRIMVYVLAEAKAATIIQAHSKEKAQKNRELALSTRILLLQLKHKIR